ncbi:MAG: nitrilase-related carbon-nitrogen hydrolase, partial [Cytophagales bacterium]
MVSFVFKSEDVRNIKIAVGSLNQIPIHWENNMNNIAASIQEARLMKVDVLLLPELCITGYGCEDLFLSDWIYEKTLNLIKELLPLSEKIMISVGLPIKHEGKRYNCSAVLKDGKIMGFVPKQFLANDGVHYEHRWFEPWTSGKISEIQSPMGLVPFGDLLFETNGYSIGFEICEDAWKKEKRPGYKLKERGADVILNPSASHFSFAKTQKRENEVVLEACKNLNVIYAYANLVG